MTFDELVAEVYDITKRPDLVTETASAVKSATLKAHRTDFYSKDIYETGVEFPNLLYKQSLDYINFIPNFRALKYIRRVTDALDENGIFFDVITPDEILDSYNKNRTDVAYVAGRVIELKASVEFKVMLMGCYVNPVVRTGAYSSWVAEQFPFAVIREAARVLFKTIGYDEQSATYQGLVAEEYALLRMSALADVGS